MVAIIIAALWDLSRNGSGYDWEEKIYEAIVEEAEKSEPKNGDSVYRVHGGESNRLGGSWTPHDPIAFSKEMLGRYFYRDYAGLSDENTGEFVTAAILKDRAAGVLVRPARSYPSAKYGKTWRGGLAE